MNIIPLGKLATEDAGRDAIHIAVAPVVAAQILSPGEHVGINGDGQAVSSMNGIGIVDPYLMRAVKPGERFYLCLYPNTITSLRHHWVHPAFKEEAPAELAKVEDDLHKEASRKWIEEYAAIGKFSYDEFMDAAKTGDYLCCEGFDTPDEYYNKEEFWKHYAVVTGRVEETGFSIGCSC